MDTLVNIPLWFVMVIDFHLMVSREFEGPTTSMCPLPERNNKSYQGIVTVYNNSLLWSFNNPLIRMNNHETAKSNL